MKLTRMLPDGREQIVGLLKGTDILGHLETSISHDNVQCVTDVELCCFRRKQFEAVLDRHPELAHYMLKKSSSDLDDARDWMTVLGKLGAIEKVARFIMRLYEQEHPRCAHLPIEAGNQVVHLLLKREEIAGFLGMTIETVSRNMTKLKSDGLIELLDAKSIRILDVDRLRDVAMSYEDDGTPG